MLEFISTYGPTILSGLSAIGTCATTVYAISKVFKIGKKVDANATTVAEEIQITKEGIVEAFKNAKIPNEWKISVSKKVTEELTSFKETFLSEYAADEKKRDKMLQKCLQILANTAAYNKLSEDDQKEVQDMINEITEEDSTIDVTEDTTTEV